MVRETLKQDDQRSFAEKMLILADEILNAKNKTTVKIVLKDESKDTPVYEKFAKMRRLMCWMKLLGKLPEVDTFCKSDYYEIVKEEQIKNTFHNTPWVCRVIGCPRVRVCEDHLALSILYAKKLLGLISMATYNQNVQLIQGKANFKIHRPQEMESEFIGPRVDMELIGIGIARQKYVFGIQQSSYEITNYPLPKNHLPIQLPITSQIVQSPPQIQKAKPSASSVQPPAIKSLQEIEQEQILAQLHSTQTLPVKTSPRTSRRPSNLDLTMTTRQNFADVSAGTLIEPELLKEKILIHLYLQHMGQRAPGNAAILSCISHFLSKRMVTHALTVVNSIEESQHATQSLKDDLRDFFLETPYIETIADDAFRQAFFYGEGPLAPQTPHAESFQMPRQNSAREMGLAEGITRSAFQGGGEGITRNSFAEHPQTSYTHFGNYALEQDNYLRTLRNSNRILDGMDLNQRSALNGLRLVNQRIMPSNAENIQGMPGRSEGTGNNSFDGIDECKECNFSMPRKRLYER